MRADFRTFETVAKAMALTLVLIFTASCSRDKREADIKQCIANVQKDASTGTLPDLTPTDTGEVRNDKMGAAVAACMTSAGYGHANFDMSDERCVTDVDFNPHCYRKAE